MDSPAVRPSQPKMASSTGGTEGSSPASSPASAASLAAMAAPKFGTLVPNRIFVGGISPSTSEAELAQLFSAYGNVKATKIIADRGGVSKGYGFVTFETEEEAKRLQQESECIILRERKLNIAPAIKKQPFNRSFDGGTGSPPAAPTSTFYYTNGIGLPYQNGMTFYNTGAPAPGAAIAPQTDPTALYQAAGVFGPQATAGHQTFAPMMYPVPAPSMYVPQQYQYSPMPYEPYYQGTTATGAPQFLFTSNGPQTQTAGSSGNGSGNGGTGSGSSATGPAGAASPASGPSMGPSPSHFQTHFYSPSAHHHPAAMAATTAPHGPPPPPPQIEPIYFAYPSHPQHAPAPHHGLTITSDQPLRLYTTDITGQIGESQVNQPEESRTTSSHAEQLHSNNSITSDSGGGGGVGGGGGSGSTSSSTQPAAQPLDLPNLVSSQKYSPVNSNARYPSHFQPHMAVSHQTSPSQSQQQIAGEIGSSVDEIANAGNPPLHHYRMPIYPTPMYVPPPVPQYPAAVASPGTSLLPTPPPQPYDKFRPDYSPVKPSAAGLVGSSPYAKGAPLIHQSPTAYAVKPYAGPGLQAPQGSHGMPGHHKYPNSRISQQQQYGKNRGLTHQQAPAGPFYYTPKSCQFSSASPRAGHQAPTFIYRGPQLSPYSLPAHHGGMHKAQSEANASSSGYPVGIRQQSARQKNAILLNNYRGPNLTMSAKSNTNNSRETSNNSGPSNVRAAETNAAGTEAATASTATSAVPTTTTTTVATTPTEVTTTTSVTESSTASSTETSTTSSSIKTSSGDPTPPPAPYSPSTRPHPNVSPSPNPNQVQLFGQSGSGSGGTGQQQRYNTSGSGLQQQRGSGNRYQSSTAANNRSGKTSSVLRQQQSSGPATGKYKVNGIVTAGKLTPDEAAASLGGGGDAPPIGARLPLTPPSTPQQQTGSQVAEQGQQQISEACHQMQALGL